nr:MAG TPA: hypothetical protein [Bacteriophage sp.]
MAYRPYRGFSWNISTYYPMALQEGHSEKELRKEYAKLRSVAQKSLKRLEQSRYEESEVYQKNKNAFPTTGSIKSKRDLARALTDVTRFLSAKSHSVSGLNEIRQEQVSTWQGQYGYTFVIFNNFDQWLQFLDWYKDMKGFVYSVDPKDPNKRWMNVKAAQDDKAKVQAMFEQFVEENYG